MKGRATRLETSAWVATFMGVALLVGCGDDAFGVCSSWCAVVEECTDTSSSQCMELCAEESSQAQSISSECALAVRSQNLCLAELICAELEAWVKEVPAETYPCKSADDEVDNACF